MAQQRITSAQTKNGDFVKPTLSTGWSNFTADVPPTTASGSYSYVRYMKDAAGVVHLSGLAKNTSGAAKNASTGAEMFTLPSGFRPGHTLRIGCLGYNGTVSAMQEIDIAPTGAVILTGSSSISNTGWVSLNSVSFVAEQ